MLSRVKQIMAKIAGIETMAECVSKTQNESKSVLNHRMCRVEDGMKEMDIKLNQIIKIQIENKLLYENILQLMHSYMSANTKP